MARLASLLFWSTLVATSLCCTVTPTASTHRLLMHRAVIDFTGLKPPRTMTSVKSSLATPVGWPRLVPVKSALYTAEQWRSPSEQTGIGVAYIRMPLPLSASAIRWFARQEYAKQSNKSSGAGKVGGKVSTWNDSLGRAWFEGESDKYHVRGYAVVRGRDAWVVYCGYRVPGTPDPVEMSLALKSVETIVPATGEDSNVNRTAETRRSTTPSTRAAPI